MAGLELFPRQHIIGVFRGFREGGLEFQADLVLPYRHEFQSIPMHGQFVLVQLETPEEAVLGRITSFSSEGRLSSESGEDFSIRAVRESRDIPEDLREDYLRYKVTIRVLGVLRGNTPGNPGRLIFVASHRRLPHVGSPVAFASGEVLREIAGHNLDGAVIGHFALGEYVYCQPPGEAPAIGSDGVEPQPWMQHKTPEVAVRFPVSSLVSRRSFVFARAGFGKSNLNKLLFSTLYAETPTVEKRGGRRAPVGTIIFDPDGEYFWPDDRGRPGLADVPHLRDRLVVFTPRRGPSAFYQSFVAGGIKLDIRQLKPADVIAIALSPERQDQQNVRKLAGLSQAKWEELVNLVDEHGNEADLKHVARLLSLDADRQDAEALAARSNVTTIVRAIHDRASQLMDLLIDALSQGKLCVVDVSLLRGGQAMVLSGLILRKIFDRNQEQFTRADARTIPTIAVIEEAQSVLNDRSTSAEPFIAWVKEGRKYDLGALMITQQPGSIPTEILSQGDNWFLFHLLSAVDLAAVRRANAHFSDDLLSVLLNEPIQGQGVFWSSAGGKAYPLPFRALSFERLYQPLDKEYTGRAVETFAMKLRTKHREALMGAEPLAAHAPQVRRNGSPGGRQTDVLDRGYDGRQAPGLDGPSPGDETGGKVDVLAAIRQQVVHAITANDSLVRRLRSGGVPWAGLQATIQGCLPSTLDGRWDRAYRLVPEVLTALFGPEKVGWETYRVDTKLHVRATAVTSDEQPFPLA